MTTANASPASRPGPRFRDTGTVRVPRFALHGGGEADNVSIAFERVGDPGAPLLVVLGGVSASRHVTATPADPSPGWWPDMVGPDRPIDIRRWQLLGIDYLGGPGGSIGGLPGEKTCAIATQDQARAVVAVLDALGVSQAHAAIGASYGGMVALALAAEAPDRIGRVVVISAADRSHPMATALRSLQRQVVRLGLEAGREAEAVAIARGIALTSYRTAPDFAVRFDHAGRSASDRIADVNAFLAHHGRAFAVRFDARAFLSLSESLDRHEVDPAAVRAPVTLVAVDSDTLVPPAQSRALHERLGARSTLHLIRSRFGHDAFLKEHELLTPIIHAAILAGGPE